jgi:hypothetical protein
MLIGGLITDEQFRSGFLNNALDAGIGYRLASH